MPRVMICDQLEPAAADLLEKAGVEVDYRPGLKGDVLKAAIRAADGVIVRSATKITADILEKPGHVRAIARAGVGIDNIDVAAATRHGIIVMNTPGGNTISAAEHTVALMMALARHVAAADASTRAGKWERSKFMGTQLAGKTLGVIGMGRIGREVARRAAGLDMHVIGFDPFVTPDRASQMNIDAVHNLDAFLPRCDFLTVHTPLTDETRDLIGAAEIAKLKSGCRIINTARGGIINEAAIAAALKAGSLAGAAFDVFESEPPKPDSPLLTAPNMILTPHLGASTLEAQDAVAREAAQLLIDYLTKGVVQFAVNMAALDRAELDEMRLYFDLARRLGLLHAQMDRGTIQQTHLTCRGEIAHRNTRLLTSAYIAGLLEQHVESINMVNAEMLARENGIEVVESTATKSGDFGSMLVAEVQTDKKKYTAAGTLFGNQFFRLVQLGPYRLDAYLDGVLLIMTHHDKPGLIGHVGGVLGQHGVNIAQMTVGREEVGGEAIAVLNLDSQPPAAAVKEIEQHAAVSSLRVVTLPAAGERPPWLG
jgi:D-3-phosphoglycerate dehydrogenase / 2-oxoglutarate reductase